MDPTLESLGSLCGVCRTRDFLPTICRDCRGAYCLEHSRAHDCIIVTRKEAPKIGKLKSLRQVQDEHLAKRAEFTKEVKVVRKDERGLSQVKALGSFFTLRGKSTSKGKEIVALAKLKKEAKGDASVPIDSRIYLSVLATDTEVPVFVHREWSVGRCLDAIAKQLAIHNENARTQDEKRRLHILDLETRATLAPSQPIAKLVRDGSRIELYRGLISA